jgi:hypothetical protein
MKRQLIAIALGSALAAPAFANNEIDAGYAPQTTFSSSTADQVFVDAEQGYATRSTHAADKSRAEVISEVTQARRSGNYIVNAELGTKANQL